MFENAPSRSSLPRKEGSCGRDSHSWSLRRPHSRSSPSLVAASSSASGAESARRPVCTITGTNGRDRLRGTSGRDVICARAGNDHVNGLDGHDIIYGGRGDDDVFGGHGNDHVRGGSGRVGGGRRHDRLLGRRGADVVWDVQGTDSLFAGRGRDELWADDGDGQDRVLGGVGHEVYCADRRDAFQSVESVYCGGSREGQAERRSSCLRFHPLSIGGQHSISVHQGLAERTAETETRRRHTKRRATVSGPIVSAEPVR